jgi:alkylation response protein AidB-like acyl-CoA dehydrogenase
MSQDIIARAKTREKGYWYEDFEPGRVFVHHWGRTLTQAENALFTSRARRDGESWILNGNKYWCTFADGADYIVVIDHPGVDRQVAIAGIAVKMTGTPGRIRRRAPLAGEHTDDILKEIGVADDQAQVLRTQGAVG